jgi:hypothetical protein
MHTRPERPADPGGDTLPDFWAVVDSANSDLAGAARHVRRRRAMRRTGEALAEFAMEAPEIVLEFIHGLLP